jgi:hypothetical protein
MDAATPIHCPQCGAPAPFRGTAVSLVCEFCGSTVVRAGVDVSLVGRVSALVDTGSPILLHARGRFDGVPFEIAGRLQVVYARGTWNEWFVTFADGTIGWLADAMGEYSMLRPVGPQVFTRGVPSFVMLAANHVFFFADRQFVVTDARAAAYRGAEGILPFVATPGMHFHAADLRGYDGAFMTLDYGTDPERLPNGMPTPYLGRSVALRELGLFPLRRFQGWQPPRPGATQAASPAGTTPPLA